MRLRLHQGALCCIVGEGFLLFLNRKTEKPKPAIPATHGCASSRRAVAGEMAPPDVMCVPTAVAHKAKGRLEAAKSGSSIGPDLKGIIFIIFSSRACGGGDLVMEWL